MPALTRLDVVNDMLATLGELPVNSLDEGHPMVPSAIRSLDIATTREQTKSWWFNFEVTTLSPDNTGNIYVPQETLKVDPLDPCEKFVQRGRRLYQPFAEDNVNKYVFTKPVRVVLTRELPFEDCPISAQLYISYSAQLDFMKSYEADNQKFQQVAAAYADALRTLMSEHIRAQDANILSRRPLSINRNTTGVLYTPGGGYYPHS